MISSYLRTILDPVNYPGVKIPDEVTAPSYTVQVLTKFLVGTNVGTSGAAGNTGAGFIRTLGNTSAANVAFATLVPGTVLNTYVPTASTSGWAAAFIAQCTSSRLVSAKATMTYLGAPNNASGRFILAFCPPNDPSPPQTSAGVFQNQVTTTVAQKPFAVDVPASKMLAEVRYVPSDDISRSYEFSSSMAISTLRGPSTQNNATYGSFVGIVDGTPISQAIEVNIWENYECIALSNLVNLVQPTASLSDPLEMAVVSNVISSNPTIPMSQNLSDSMAGTAQQTTVKGSLTTSATQGGVTLHKREEPSFMDKILGFADKAIDIGKKALPVAAGIAALL